MNAIIRHVPSPAAISSERISSLLRGPNLTTIPDPITQLFSDCSSKSETKIFFISKMISVPKSDLPRNKRGPMTMEEIKQKRQEIEQMKLSQLEPNILSEKSEKPVAEKGDEEDKSEHVFIAIGRVFSGKLTKGMKIMAMGPKYKPGSSDYSEEIQIGQIYLLMGRDLIAVDEANAGSIVGIGGINSNIILNSGTLSSTLDVPSFSPIYQDNVPILRVAVEPVDLNNMNALRKGVKLLNIADPCVEIVDSATGELVVAACGEVHLEKCLDDLQKYYAKVINIVHTNI